MGLTDAINIAVSPHDDAPASVLDNRLFTDGAVVGPWRVLALLGGGGNGEVYRVEHVKSGELGALKVPSSTNQNLRRRFDIEQMALSKIDAARNGASDKALNGLKHLPRLLDSGMDAKTGIPYFVIELLQEKELPKKSPAVRKLILDVCEAVRELHKIGYLHRDIKPENLMWRNGKEVVLIDFGLSCATEECFNPLEERLSLTQGRICGVGTEGSAAPEQLFGHASVQSEIYSLGALAERCFDGNPPDEWGRIILGAINSRADYRFGDLDKFVHAVKSGVPRWRWWGFVKKNWANVFIGFVVVVSAFNSAFNSESQWPQLPEEEQLEPLYHAATQGNIRAQWDLGRRYYYGHGVAKTPSEARKWLYMAAEQGLKEAQNLLGMYYREYAYPVDSHAAVEWFHKAAEQGLKEAQVNLALCYHSGFGVPVDKVKSEKWLQAAAEQGSETALEHLVDWYTEGYLTPTNRQMVIHWYRKAAEQGNLSAQYALGECYANGDGVAVNKTEAAKWYRLAADQLYARAQYVLGVCYENGDGVPKDKVEAMKWYDKAAKQGLKEAVEARCRLSQCQQCQD